jgi:glyoxylase-like metal-dependent hydrolase (beta-lactamase superfamily II)
MHRREKDWLEKAMLVHPPGATIWGRILEAFTGVFVMPLFHFPATNVDVVVGDEGLSLAEYGIPGRVIYTPGHSMGSVSVLLDSGDAFVGDSAVNRFPLRLSPGLPLPIFAENLQILKKSWLRLLEQGAKTVYPAHGKPFSAEVIRKSLL